MGAIGGYFELADYEEGVFPHQDGILVNTGRNALEYILRSIGDVKRVYLPYYTSEVVLEPLKKLHIPWVFYHINARFEINDEIIPREGEYMIANNYFGIKDAYIESLAEKYGDCLIVDCAQAFFARPIPGIKCFYSARKYVGVADGGVAYLGNVPDGNVDVQGAERTEDHDSHLLKRKEFGAEAGFADYQGNERKLDGQPIHWMSKTTKQILDHIDYNKVLSKRKDNYRILHQFLAERNGLVLPAPEAFACPMVYPFLVRSGRSLRKELINNKVFVATYWPNACSSSEFVLEADLVSRILPLPCDHRYGEEEMRRITKIIIDNK